MKRVFFLGAGFSAPAGGPIQNEIIASIFELENNTRYNYIHEAIERIGRFKAFLRIDLCIDPAHYKFVRLEDIFTPIDRCLADKTSFRSRSWKDLSKLREEIYSLIVLGLQSWFERDGYTNKYVRSFADYLNRQMEPRIGDPKHDVVSVISTNWDILLDNRLKESLDDSASGKGEARGYVDYCCYLSSLDDDPSIKPGLWALGKGGYNVKLLKVHGSTNWLHCPLCQRLFVAFNEKLAESIINAPRHCQYCRSGVGGSEAAMLHSNLIMPTFLKDLTNFQIKLVWQNAGVELSEATEVIFMGYSLPEADFECRALLSKFVHKDAKIILVQQNPHGDVKIEDYNKEIVNRYKSFFGRRSVEPVPEGIEQFIYSLPA